MALVALLLAGSGCKNPFKPTDLRARVYSNTRWSGTFDGRLTITEAYGNMVIDLRDDLPVCVVVCKLTSDGVLSLKVTGRDGMTTTEPYDTLCDCPRLAP